MATPYESLITPPPILNLWQRFRIRHALCLLLLATFPFTAHASPEVFETNSTLAVDSPDSSQVVLKFCHARSSALCSTYTFAHLDTADWSALNESAVVIQSYLQTGHALALGGGSLNDIKAAAQKAEASLGAFGKEYLRVTRQILATLARNRDQCDVRLLKTIKGISTAIDGHL